MHSPLQGAHNIKINKIAADLDSISIYVNSLGAHYKARLTGKDTVLDGIFTQAVFSIPMRMTKTKELFALKRPQNPKAPFDYSEEEVSFYNAADEITLAGTLTYPKGDGPFPAVILITGSGPQNRDEEILGHKPFLVIANHFTRNGIAVLRFDDRGVGQSEGNFSAATSKDFAQDAEAAFDFLQAHPKINAEKVGFLGHSEGGMIAPIIASRNDAVSFIIMLAGPGLKGEDVLRTQLHRIMTLENTDPEIIEFVLKDYKQIFQILKQESDKQKAAESIRTYLTKRAEELPEELHMGLSYTSQGIEMKIFSMNSDWFRYFLTFDPEYYLKQMTCPVLALFGEKDVQVTVPENITALENIIQKHNKDNFTVLTFPGKNHLFQNAQTGAVSEYALIEETICPEVLEKMTDWIHKVLKSTK